jgi:predicted CoA-substrate-specific enzyme activase
LDVGSLTLKLVRVDDDGGVLSGLHRNHEGRPVAAVAAAARELGLSNGARLGVTGGGGGPIASALGLSPVDSCRATIRGVRTVVPAARNIIDVGGSSITLIELDDAGELRNYSTNSVCAAGTGSFLDAQARRMGLSDEDLDGLEGVESPPTIATRCAVFAKSDLIHRQQEGYGTRDLWCGLCRGMSSTLLQTLLKGKPLNGLTVLTGGVAKNREVLRWLNDMQHAEIVTFEGAEFAAAAGAALINRSNGSRPRIPLTELRESVSEDRTGRRRPPLSLRRSTHPEFETGRAWTDEAGNEIRVGEWPDGGIARVYMGLDVGSTSTKLALVDDEGAVLADIYRKTAGAPVAAIQKLLAAVTEIARRADSEVEIMGAGATGSGRKLAGAVIGADAVVNEITAHLKGAIATDPEVDTIFEIGGQDSKYIRVRNGSMRDSNMNYVCAAGTGSFVEEQALKLGYQVADVGDLVEGVRPPHTSDRCTVFMEQDVEKLLRQGYSSAEALAAVMYSVVENYLAKVVGTRHRSPDKIFFCGATARNKGLVAAFEQLVGAEIVVSPYCHVLGAYGVALLARERVRDSRLSTVFKGLDLSNRAINLRQEPCDLCANECRITFAEIEGEDEQPSWGYLCGRDPDASEKKKRDEYEAFRTRARLAAEAFARNSPRPGRDAPVIGIPATLSTFSHGPLWKTFMANLGFRVKTSRPTGGDTKTLAASLSGAEYCFPAKLSHGHVAQLAAASEVEWVFMPYTVSQEVEDGFSNAFFCPVVCGMPQVVRSALKVGGHGGADRILSPRVDFRWDEKRQVKALTTGLEPLQVTSREVRAAWRKALGAQRWYEESCVEAGRSFMEARADRDEAVIVCLGRAYNLYDGGANLELPQKISEYGFPILPLDMLPLDEVELGPEYGNIYWAYGQKLLKGLHWTMGQERAFPVWFTNFKCGPDSFLLSYAERIVGEDPLLVLELDEHGGDAGYLTRVEAYLDLVRSRGTSRSRPRRLPMVGDAPETFLSRRLWVPPMHPFAAPLAAAAMRGAGLDAQVLPEENEETLAVGRQVTRGGECIPMTLTIGRLVQSLREIGGDGGDQALFMPSACGPCRFGQYNLLERIILEREGFGEIALLSPNNDNAYQGLDEQLRRRIWIGTLAGDLLFKIGCRFRPYEEIPGSTDAMLSGALADMVRAFEQDQPLRPAFREALLPFRALPAPGNGRPLVGVVGEIFVRCSPFANQDVVRTIESQGGEAWLAPFHEWVLYAAWEHERRAKQGWDIKGQARSYLKNKYFSVSEHQWYGDAGELLADRHEPSIQESADAALPYAEFNFGGEVLVTIGRTIHFFEQGARLVVNCAPFGCMPGQTITGILNEVQQDHGRPVLSLFYEGTGDLNARIGVFLQNLHD